MSTSIQAANLFRVDDLVAVVTGGGTGIGLMMTNAFVVNGAKKVYVLGRRAEPLEAAAAAHPAGVVVPIVCDVTSKDSLQAAVDRVAAETGYINVLVSNSGTLGPMRRYDPALPLAELRRRLFDEYDPDEFNEVLRVNVTGAWFAMLAFVELLGAGNEHAMAHPGAFGAPSRPGAKVPDMQSQVIFTSSVAAFMRAPASIPPYGSSKAALLWLAKQAATNLAGYGIRVNTLAPGLFPSDIAQSLMGNRKPDEETPENPNFIPARKFGGDEEMAGAVLFLVSRAGSFCDGTTLLNDGGRASVCPSSY